MTGPHVHDCGRAVGITILLMYRGGRSAV